LSQAANFLNVQRLMDAGCRALADTIKDKSVEEMRAMFGIENDFTPEEEEEIKKQNAWCQGAFK
jgi:S-phase kinase-associated protein 1